MAIKVDFTNIPLRIPGRGGWINPKEMKNKLKQFKSVKGAFPCKHTRVTKSFFMKDESRPMWHCDICMVEMFPEDPIEDSASDQNVSGQKN